MFARIARLFRRPETIVIPDCLDPRVFEVGHVDIASEQVDLLAERKRRRR